MLKLQHNCTLVMKMGHIILIIIHCGQLVLHAHTPLMLHPTYPFSNTCILGSPSCSTSMEAELSQCTSGNGLPVATQSKSAVLPSSNCCISGEVVTLGVAGEGGGGGCGGVMNIQIQC